MTQYVISSAESLKVRNKKPNQILIDLHSTSGPVLSLVGKCISTGPRELAELFCDHDNLHVLRC